jgi:hypothetical protein
MILYPVFMYTAIAMVIRLKLNALAEACAAGLCVLLLDIPFETVAVKQLFYTWHDTDHNLADRFYFVPWTVFYFMASFSASYTLFFHGTRSVIGHGGGFGRKMEADGFIRETFCSVLALLLGLTLGYGQFIPFHKFHDEFKIHAEVCVLVFIALYYLTAWTSDRCAAKEQRANLLSGLFSELGLLVLTYFASLITLAAVVQPEFIRSVGLHQPTGNCDHVTPIRMTSGQVVSRQTYLCTSNFDEPYFDFHCLREGKVPADGLSWYEICGTPFTNHCEHVLVVSALCVFGFWVYLQLLAHSGQQPRGYAAAVDKWVGRLKVD